MMLCSSACSCAARMLCLAGCCACLPGDGTNRQIACRCMRWTRCPKMGGGAKGFAVLRKRLHQKKRSHQKNHCGSTIFIFWKSNMGTLKDDLFFSSPYHFGSWQKNMDGNKFWVLSEMVQDCYTRNRFAGQGWFAIPTKPDKDSFPPFHSLWELNSSHPRPLIGNSPWEIRDQVPIAISTHVTQLGESPMFGFGN
jgi:hypothetical protein